MGSPSMPIPSRPTREGRKAALLGDATVWLSTSGWEGLDLRTALVGSHFAHTPAGPSLVSSVCPPASRTNLQKRTDDPGRNRTCVSSLALEVLSQLSYRAEERLRSASRRFAGIETGLRKRGADRIGVMIYGGLFLVKGLSTDVY